MVADFTWSFRACSGVLRLWGSCRGLAVLGSCSSGVQHPLRAGAAIWVTENLRGSSLGQPNSEGWPENIGRSFSQSGQACCSFSGLQVVLQKAALPSASPPPPPPPMLSLDLGLPAIQEGWPQQLPEAYHHRGCPCTGLLALWRGYTSTEQHQTPPAP